LFLLLALLAAPAAQAAVHAQATASSWVRIGQQPKQFAYDPPNGGFNVSNGFSVAAGVNNFISTTNNLGVTIGSTANASIGFLAGRPFMDLLTASQPGTDNEILAGGQLRVDGSITGAPGRAGMLDLSGALDFFIASTNGYMPPWSSASVSVSTLLRVSGPGQAACPQQSCVHSAAVNPLLHGGEVSAGALSMPFDFHVPVLAGDRVEIFLTLGGQVSNGYYAVMFAGAPRGPEVTDGVVSLFGTLALSEGLGLSPDTGLVQGQGGVWGVPVSTVPEAPAWLLLGLGLVAFRRRLVVAGRAVHLEQCR
jgi:hypothetical protein